MATTDGRGLGDPRVDRRRERFGERGGAAADGAEHDGGEDAPSLPGRRSDGQRNAHLQAGFCVPTAAPAPAPTAVAICLPVPPPT